MPNLSPQDIVIVAAKRTPIGGFSGQFSDIPSPELGGIAIKAALNSAGLTPDKVDEVIMGLILSGGVGQAPARQASLNAGLPISAPCTTVNKVCGSGMKSIMLAHDAIKAGTGEIYVAGGMENMSRAPYLLPKARGGYRLGHGELKDHMFCDALEDAYNGELMGQFADANAKAEGITREQMDAFALTSLERAQHAVSNGLFVDEIAPVTHTTRKGEAVYDTDETPGQARPEKIPQLKPAFSKDGGVTAANASSISDGAAALIICSNAAAEQHGLSPLACIRAHATHAEAPNRFTHAPIGSIQKVIDKAGWSAADVDLYEINEAFAMVVIAAINKLDLDPSTVNVNGGGCALGHPIGASGARIVVTLIHALKRLNKSKGVASLCLGGGEAVALALELC